MRKFVIATALVALTLPVAPAMARQATGYTIRTTVMHAGPDYDFPTVQRLKRNSALTVYGCLKNWSWCDVGTRYARGWVPHRDIVVEYRGRRIGITPSMGIIVLSFSFGNYWDNHYRGRPFYSQRSRWEQRYSTHYRQEWGPRRPEPKALPRPVQPHAKQQPQPAPRVQPAPHRNVAPNPPGSVARDQPGASRHGQSPVPPQASGNVPGGRGGDDRAKDNRDQDRKPPR